MNESKFSIGLIKKLMKLRTMVNLRQNFVEESTRFQNQIKSVLAKHGIHICEKTNFSKKWCEQFRLAMAEHPELLELRYAYEHYLLIESKIESLDAETITYCKSYWNKQIGLLDSTPGIAETCSTKRFSSKKKLRRYAGVNPVFKRIWRPRLRK